MILKATVQVIMYSDHYSRRSLEKGYCVKHWLEFSHPGWKSPWDYEEFIALSWPAIRLTTGAMTSVQVVDCQSLLQQQVIRLNDQTSTFYSYLQYCFATYRCTVQVWLENSKSKSSVDCSKFSLRNVVTWEQCKEWKWLHHQKLSREFCFTKSPLLYNEQGNLVLSPTWVDNMNWPL